MSLTKQIASQLRQIHFGGNWTGANLREKLEGLTWQQATTPIPPFHPIATLVVHMNYYIAATIEVLRGGPLDASDEKSFDHAPIDSAEAWEHLLEKTWSDAEELATLIEQLSEERLWEVFVENRYGNYYRCLHGPIEHCHYHTGQIAMIRTMLESGTAS